jgi:hypothetical protein
VRSLIATAHEDDCIVSRRAVPVIRAVIERGMTEESDPDLRPAGIITEALLAIEEHLLQTDFSPPEKAPGNGNESASYRPSRDRAGPVQVVTAAGLVVRVAGG